MKALYLAGICLLAAGCSSSPTLYHTLAVDAANVPVATAVSARISSLGVGPLSLPTLLDREGMVLRKDPQTVEVSDTHQWGGQLQDEFLRSLAQQLRLRLPATRVQIIPWELNQTPRYQVAVTVDQFDGVPGQRAVLRGSWQLQQAGNGKIISNTPINVARNAVGHDITGVVSAQSSLVADLAQQIVDGLEAQP
jgi:uncharacterized lipoprotein YmbA